LRIVLNNGSKHSLSKPGRLTLQSRTKTNETYIFTHSSKTA
jgi:hypothetical protein